MVVDKDNQCGLLDGCKRGIFIMVAILLTLVHKGKHTLASQRLNIEYLMDNSAVADPPVAMRIRPLLKPRGD